MSALSHPKKYGFVISNPPYGERLEDKASLPALYREIGERYRALDAWSMYLITSYEDAEKYIGRKADKNRKIYNGMLKTCLLYTSCLILTVQCWRPSISDRIDKIIIPQTMVKYHNFYEKYELDL